MATPATFLLFLIRKREEDDVEVHTSAESKERERERKKERKKQNVCDGAKRPLNKNAFAPDSKAEVLAYFLCAQ